MWRRWLKFSTLLIIVLFATSVVAQKKYTLSGYVRDSSNGENLVGANIIIKELQKGAMTNSYGFYSITLPKGEYTVIYSFVGYQKKTFTINLSEKKRKNVNLAPTSYQTKEVVVKGEEEDKNVRSTDMGKAEIPIQKMKELPVIFGEADVMKTIKLMPGVQSAAEGNTGIYVRGGGPDQNLILLDEAPVYNTGHLFGFFSVFNADAINSTTLIKGGMPANYGGRLSSVVDITMKEGNAKEYNVQGGIGTIASRLTVEGPIVKDKSSFLISGRRTYIDLLMKPFTKGTNLENSGYYFYDLNTKFNYKFSDRDRLYLSGYFGRDVFSFASPDQEFQVDIPWGNMTTTLRWNHLFSDQLFMNMSVIYNDYNFRLEAEQNNFSFEMLSGIRDVNLKTDFDYHPSTDHTVKFGMNYIYHTFIPSSTSGSSGDEDLLAKNVVKQYAHEAAVYALDEFKLSQRFKINTGLRVPFFQQIGPHTQYEYDYLGRKADSTVYGRGEPIATYWGLEPRINARYRLNRKSSIKASYSVTNQYLHLVSNSGTTLPTDIWVPSSKRVKPQKGTQYSVGYYRNFKDNTYETSVELFYRDMKNQIQFRNGYVPTLNEDISKDFVFGRGWAYGVEFYIKKRYGKFNGWIGYTLSATRRQFDKLNEGEPFPAKYDRTHDLSIVAMYNLNKRWTFSTTFVFATGNAITLPKSRYLINGVLTGDYGERNNFRMPPYHRLDLSATLHPKEESKFKSTWNLSIYNVYNRHNPYFIYFDNEGEGDELNIVAKKVYIFPIIPAITWNFKF